MSPNIELGEAVRARLLSGEDPEDIARDLDLDVVESDDGEPMIALPGYVAADEDCRGSDEVEYPYADTAREAAQDYVDGGDWGDERTETAWIRVRVWRAGLRAAAVECAYCSARATGHDGDGDPACAEHARQWGPAEEGIELAPLGTSVVECRSEPDLIRVRLDPPEPPCEGGAEHDWQTPYDIVGGLPENPGVFAHGGGVYIRSVCLACGCGRVTDTWAQDRATGEQGLTSVRYEPGKYADEVRALAEGTAAEDSDR